MPNISRVTATLPVSTNYLVTLEDDLGHAWSADEPIDVGGANAAPDPTRLMLASLGACTAITLRMVAVRRQWPLADIHVTLELNPNGKPASGNDIVRRIRLEGELNEEQRAQLLKISNACPMHKLLTGEVRVDSSIA
ncbi:OsmC family protein [Roseateles koreensis]|uniref:OsmC family protein n=1 Tax=Roseateles koreensis TaxID=2987526 RepID=A0ABT5KLR6_9BURK|nr:OsmC family protein [Roseateles koreensis]MDC8783857.1 OsmC family protein [Roseateles koreensis]